MSSSSLSKSAKTAKTTKAPARRQSSPRVLQHPQSKQAAADAAGMFLRTDDTWSMTYFDPNDLHFKERQLFG